MMNNTASKKYDKLHALFAFLALVLGSLYYRLVLFSEAEWKTTLFIFVLIFCAYTLAYFLTRKIKLSFDSYFFLALTVISGLPFSASSEIASLFNVFCPHLFGLLFIASCAKSDHSLTDNIIPETFKSVFVYPFASFFSLILSFTGLIPKTDDETRSKRYKTLSYVIIGIVIAIPVVAVICALLLSDVFFENSLKGFSEFFDSLIFSVFEYFNFFTILVSMYIYGAMYSAQTGKCARREREYKIPHTTVNTVLTILCALYVLFIITQIQGYSCMIFGRVPEGETYSSFARSGFFELCITAVINGMIIYAANVFCDKSKDIKHIRCLCTLVAALTFFLIFTAMFKMCIYINVYGFTEKRICTMLFMLLLTAIFVLSLIKLYRKSLPLSRICTYMTGIWTLVLIFVDFEKLSSSLNSLLGYIENL